MLMAPRDRSRRWPNRAALATFTLAMTTLTVWVMADDSRWEIGRLNSWFFGLLALLTAVISIAGVVIAIMARSTNIATHGLVIHGIGVAGLFVLVDAYGAAAVVGAIAIAVISLCNPPTSGKWFSSRTRFRSQNESNSNQQLLQSMGEMFHADGYERAMAAFAVTVTLYFALSISHFALADESHRESRHATVSTLPTQRTIEFIVYDNPTGKSPTLRTSPLSTSLEYYSSEIAVVAVTLIVGALVVTASRAKKA